MTAASARAETPTWSDEFNGDWGTLPSDANWAFARGGRWGGGAELQCYTGPRVHNIREDGWGKLSIKTHFEPGHQCSDGINDYTSARISTAGRKKFGYGRIEAKMKMSAAPDGQPPIGIWPAFWTLGVDYEDGLFGGMSQWPETGEIDIIEWLGRSPDYARLHLHSQDDDGSEWKPGARIPGTWSGWHTYAIDHRPGRIDFSIDDQVVWTKRAFDAPLGAWDFDKEKYIVLNVAVGGWGGTPDPSHYPARTLIDYVRYWAY